VLRARRCWGAVAGLVAFGAVVTAAAPVVRAQTAGASACVESADKVLAWDAPSDLYVVASYLERDRPPGSDRRIFPNLIELRRISTGAQLGLVNCAVEPGALRAASAVEPCDYRTLFGSLIPARAGFHRHGTALDRSRLAVKGFAEGGDRAYALMSRPPGSPAWHRVMWLGDEVLRAPERMSVHIVDGERWQGDVLLVLAIRHEGGACKSTEAKMIRLRQIDLDAPAAIEHQRHLLTRLKESSPFAGWRSAAEIAPLPPERLIAAMVAAAEAGKPDFAARWWNESTKGLPPAQLAALAAALRDRPELVETLRLIRLPDVPASP
jgi:hypothetical protein